MRLVGRLPLDRQVSRLRAGLSWVDIVTLAKSCVFKRSVGAGLVLVINTLVLAHYNSKMDQRFSSNNFGQDIAQHAGRCPRFMRSHFLYFPRGYW